MAIERTCIGCRNRDSTDQLLRIVSKDRHIVVDVARTASGRGAYVHSNPKCVSQAVNRKAITRALRVLGDIDLTALQDLST